ncbi:MAG: AIPR family protein [Rhodospirillaceae bacterium]|jgi:hypothetical protein|nr:AIPR family protein [Rhodospirillaceae bacterium]MBT7484736.1 AIPR family protein [Rhodospirillales bacterium]
MANVAELDAETEELNSDIDFYSVSSGDQKATSFFQIFHEAAVENGDFPDLDYTSASRINGRDSYRIDGIYIDEDRREAYLAVCDYRQSEVVESMDTRKLEQNFNLGERFFKLALQPEFLQELEETSPAFQAAILIFTNQTKISRVRIIVLSNARLATRKKTVESKEIDGRTFTYSVLDMSRYADIKSASNGSEPLDIDLKELNGNKALPCLPAYSESKEYRSYLIALPAILLSEIYGRYGARLLEQNVRSFLQARTKVNRGIIDTIGKEPDMFFAYNNGLTVTASGIQSESIGDGQLGISVISNMQIVNGGQTTASILYARDLRKADLDHVYVQMKLSVINPDNVEDIVPKISRYANTQNRISEADFFAGHPFHVELERMSRRITAPPRAGHIHGSKWFYERARGQYADKRAYGTGAQKRKFETEYPKDQVITKTDLAKSVVALDGRPQIVSQGAQKCFMNFATSIGEIWDGTTDPKTVFNDRYYRDVISAAIIFKWCDKMVGGSEWYRNDRGYKAQTIAYTVSWLANHVKSVGKAIDLNAIWNGQQPPEMLQEAMEKVAPIVASAIRNAPEYIINIGEYTKREACWDAVRKLDIDLPPDLDSCLVSEGELADQERDARQEGAIDSEVQLEMLAFKCVGITDEIRDFAKSGGFLSPRGNTLLNKIKKSSSLTKQDLNVWTLLVKHLKENNFELPEL